MNDHQHRQPNNDVTAARQAFAQVAGLTPAGTPDLSPANTPAELPLRERVERFIIRHPWLSLATITAATAVMVSSPAARRTLAVSLKAAAGSAVMKHLTDQ